MLKLELHQNSRNDKARRFLRRQKWPAQYPDRLQLYSLPTLNGMKVPVILEEVGLPYEAHRVNFETNDQLSSEFVNTFANNKIPAIIEPNASNGQPLVLFESGAILLYLAEKTGKLLPNDPLSRHETIQ